MHMRSRQTGVSLMLLIGVLVLLGVLALFAMKTLPSFMEFRAAKAAIEAVARERQGASPADIRRAFENRATIDDINTIKPTDLEIGKDGSATVISFAYRKEVPLFANFGVYFDFAANSKGR